MDELGEFLETAVADTLRRVRIVFAATERASGRVAGSTAYGNLAESERRLEIGWWRLAAESRRTVTTAS